MQDVIFGGAPGRQAAGSATVELVLDDSEGVLGLGPEVSILRRLERNGEGEYRIGGARCRLIDVIEVLSDTGLGKEMHSVISQGRVEAIVTSKPRDRRLLIEEAAGLGKHRKRRRRAQLKLGHTQDNLDRALDVEREARSRLKPLKRQAEAAELHERIHRQTLEVRWELARDELRSRRAELELATEQAAQARAQRAGIERELEAVAARRRETEEALAARSSQREELSRRSFAAQSAADGVGFRADSVRVAGQTVSARLARAESELQQLLEDAQDDRSDPEAEGRIAALSTELEGLERDRESELARQLADLERQLAAVAGVEQQRITAVEAAQLARDAADAAHEGARVQLREAERAVDAARRETARAGGELAAVNQFLRSHQAAPGGVGSLADALTVAPGYELAVAAALDGRLGAAVLDDRAAAGVLLDRAGRDGGRVLVLREPGDPGRAAPTPPVPGSALLCEHISGDSQAAAIARDLLRDVWIVEEVSSVPDSFAGVAVTAAGRVYSGLSGELRQAAKVGEERVLAERNRRDELIKATEAAAQAEHVTRVGVEAAAARVAELEAAREEAIAAQRTATDSFDEAVEEQRRLEAAVTRRRTAPDQGPGADRRAQVHAQLKAERAGLEHAERERARRAAQTQRLQAGIARDRELVPEITAVHSELVALGDAIAGCKARFDAELANDREAGESIAAQLRECAREEAGIQARLHAAGEALTGAEVRLQRSRDQTADAEQALLALATELQLEPAEAEEPLAAERRDELMMRLERLAKRREQLGPVNPLAQDEYAEALAHVEELEAQRTDLETALRELEGLIRDTDRQIRETFEQTFEAAARNFEELAERVFPGGSGRLRLVAESEGRATVLGGQQLDGADESADAGEEDVADSPPDEGEVSADEDLLGVEIEITPGGKAMKRLTLLSGGRSR